MALTYDITIDLDGGYDVDDGVPMTEAKEAAIRAEIEADIDAMRDAAAHEAEMDRDFTYGFGFVPDDLVVDPIPF